MDNSVPVPLKHSASGALVFLDKPPSAFLGVTGISRPLPVTESDTLHRHD